MNDLLIEANEFFPIKDISYIISSDYKLVGYEEKENSLIGEIDFMVEYFLNNNQGIMEECLKIKFTIYNENYKINKLEVIDLKPSVLDNQGISVDYKIDLNYEEVKKNKDEEEKKEEIIIIEDKEEIEDLKLDEIKTKIVESIDEKLKESLIEKELFESKEEFKVIKKDDNLDKYDRFIKENRKSVYKIVYVNDEIEIETLANNYHKSIKDIYRDTNYDVKNRVIIKL